MGLGIYRELVFLSSPDVATYDFWEYQPELAYLRFTLSVIGSVFCSTIRIHDTIWYLRSRILETWAGRNTIAGSRQGATHHNRAILNKLAREVIRSTSESRRDTQLDKYQ